MLFPSAPIAGQLVLITDQLAAPADFLLHQILAVYIKTAAYDGASTRPKAVVVSVSEPLARWKAVAARSNLNLTQKIEDQSLVFLDVPPNGPSTLRPLLDRVRSTVHALRDACLKPNSASDRPTPNLSPVLVVVDDIAALSWIGHPLSDVARFLRALTALCTRESIALVIRHHTVIPDEPSQDDLLRILLQLSSLHFDVLPLASGKSGAVALHAGRSLHPAASTPPLIPRTRALQYRLTDSGAVFFERGTGAAVV
ncbi:hypothetical protein HETIRDRAFT_311089 [Heterobasidion irregulare TC 32-1]|uniref:Elongator complex protein 5 n=1 Tax=Heterobasidion irregulare (strain TC 32-1) TaxID=747525 RepID=W4KGL1_HETIT|nr:uncharacterized protein HETIRDRAFT_311089 [Heterobasidion irregulare TC 32-1]ETW84998.1 hypothetical protein HETIRDRAFT_311089 [Heterobasidion irregulare TC 32-1]